MRDAVPTERSRLCPFKKSAGHMASNCLNIGAQAAGAFKPL